MIFGLYFDIFRKYLFTFAKSFFFIFFATLAQLVEQRIRNA